MQASVRSATKFGFASLLLFAAAACSGGGDSPTTPPGGGGGGGGGGSAAPSTMVVAAGDAQAAAPGVTLAVNPAVLVRDATGKAFAGATVIFTVDSGGGTIASSTATTGSDGIAAAGKWTLGSAGPQVLGVTSGSLPRVKLRATLRTPESSLASQTVGPSGGTITIDKSGSPLNGLTMTIPGGALASATTITLTGVPTAGFTAPIGLTVVSSSALGIRASQGTLTAPALVRFPVTAKPGQVSMLVLRNAATGAIALLPTVASDASSITVALSSLDVRGVSSARLATQTISLSLASAAADGDALLLQVAIDPSLLARDFDSGFRPGVDDWDFVRQPIASLPFLDGFGDPRTAIDPADGMVASAIWYYVNRKPASGGLNRKYQLQAGVPESNRDGIRWSAIASKDVIKIISDGAIATKWQEQISLDAAGFAQAQLTGIKAMFLLGFGRPVPVHLFTSGEDLAPRIGIAYRVTGNSVDIAVPDDPGASYRATYSALGMTPFDVVGANRSTYQVRQVAGLHYSMVVNDASLSSQWSRVTAGTIGDSEGWPAVELHYEDARLDTANVFLAEKLGHWWECTSCPEYGYRPSTVPASASHVLMSRFGKFGDDGFAGLGNLFPSMGFGPDVIPEETDTQKVGFAVYLPGPGPIGGGADTPGWLGWNTVTYKRLRLQPEPSEVALGAADTAVTFTLKPRPTPPKGTLYAWVLRTDKGRDSVETADGTHTRDIKAGTEGMLLIMALEPATRRVIGRDSVVISADSASPYWRLNTIADQDAFFDEDSDWSGDGVAVLQRLLATPNSAMLAIEELGTGPEVNLRVMMSGTWQAEECCPLAPSNPGSVKVLPLGPSPWVEHPVGPFFAGWGYSGWSQTTEDLSSGSMTGQSVEEWTSYTIHDEGSQTGPAGGVRLTATRSGKALSGTIAFYIWYTSGRDGEIHDPVTIYRFPFTATRMR